MIMNRRIFLTHHSCQTDFLVFSARGVFIGGKSCGWETPWRLIDQQSESKATEMIRLASGSTIKSNLINEIFNER